MLDCSTGYGDITTYSRNASINRYTGEDKGFMINLNRLEIIIAPIAQLDRVSDFESEGCRFDSYWAHQIHQIVFTLLSL